MFQVLPGLQVLVLDFLDFVLFRLVFKISPSTCQTQLPTFTNTIDQLCSFMESWSSLSLCVGTVEKVSVQLRLNDGSLVSTAALPQQGNRASNGLGGGS